MPRNNPKKINDEKDGKKDEADFTVVKIPKALPGHGG